MQNKIKIGALALLSVFALSACDEIVAKPSDYDSPIVTVTNYDEKIHNDIMSVIYDKIHEGSFGEQVLNEILFEYATSVLGRYNSVIKDNRSSASSDTITLKKAFKGITMGPTEPSGNADTDAFIAAHKAYWTVDQATGERKTDHDSKVAEYNRVLAKWNTIEERICEKFNSDFSSSTAYQYRSKYSEELYLRNLKGELNNVKNPDSLSASERGYNIFISPDAEPTDIFNYLTRSYYQTSYDKEDNVANDSTWATYVEDKIIPEIYQQLLVEQYLYDQSYNTLGGSFARRVNVIAIPENSAYPKAAKSLVDALVDKIHTLGLGQTALPVDPKDENFADEGLNLFKFYSGILTGVDLSEAQSDLLTSLVRPQGFENKSIGVAPDVTNYFGGTEYGDVLDKFAKIHVDRRLNDSSIESEFTGNGAYTIETGLEIKRLETERKDHTTTGWYIKNGGLSELPESIRSRLFSTNVANSLDMKQDVAPEFDRYQYDATTGWSYDAHRDYNSYVARINSRFYLQNDKVLAEDSQNGKYDIVFHDTSSSTYYIVQICEACTTSKLAKNGSKNYASIRSSSRMEAIINDVLKVVGKGDSYKTSATKHWLKEAGISYHDQVVYDYFKSNYPDLFED